ncbi:MAG: A24 family peptidase [Holosporales bacterium]|jgi:Flp pilus assembly protein protease CpaA|nr:A24 family peptidase [Holosporales bacterium]
MGTFILNEEKIHLYYLLLSLIPWMVIIKQDERFQIIPEGGLFCFFVLSCLHLYFTPIFWESICTLGGGAVLVHKIFPVLLRKPVLGGGDVKLLCLCSLWIPISILPIFLAIVGSVGCLRCVLSRKRRIPFAFPTGCGWFFCVCKVW